MKQPGKFEGLLNVGSICKQLSIAVVPSNQVSSCMLNPSLNFQLILMPTFEPL